jgi:hypothetical protein
MSISARTQRLLEHRWLLVPLAVVIGLVSAFLLYLILRADYWAYWLEPKLKNPDPYSYAQLRYRAFDVVLVLCCIDGLIAAGLSLRRVFTSRDISGWPYRTMILYFILLVVLFLGGNLMFYARSHGY